MTATDEKPETKSKPKPKRKEFKVRPGELVWWYRNGITTNDPLPAMAVIANKNGIMNLTVFQPESHPVPVLGCRHKDDPDLNMNNMRMSGCWAERPKR